MNACDITDEAGRSAGVGILALTRNPNSNVWSPMGYNNMVTLYSLYFEKLGTSNSIEELLKQHFVDIL